MAAASLKRALRLGLLAASLAVAAALAAESWQLARASRVNHLLAAALAEPSGPDSPVAATDPRLWVVAARGPAAAGRVAQAAALLRQSVDASRGAVKEAALYDLGNVYLREALRLQQSGADASALPLMELAKESYRTVLLEHPDLWDAKFNLELALRASPDPDPDDTGAPQLLSGERAVTTMRAFTLGLP